MSQPIRLSCFDFRSSTLSPSLPMSHVDITPLCNDHRSKHDATFHNENDNMNFGYYFSYWDQIDAGRISNSLSRLEVESKSAPLKGRESLWTPKCQPRSRAAKSQPGFECICRFAARRGESNQKIKLAYRKTNITFLCSYQLKTQIKLTAYHLSLGSASRTHFLYAPKNVALLITTNTLIWIYFVYERASI